MHPFYKTRWQSPAIHNHGPVLSTTRTTTNASSELAYKVHPGQGPYLLLVHGFLSSNAQWQLNLEALSKVSTPVTAELWGHGESPAPADLNCYQPSYYLQQFERIRHELAAQQWFVCGYSLGASLTIRYAHTYPDNVVGQCFTNSNSAFADDDQVASWRASAEVSAAGIERGGLTAIDKIAVHPRRAKRLPEPVYTALVEDSKRLNPLGVANTLRITTPNASTRSLASGNSRPALLCHGFREKRFLPQKEWAEQNMTNLEIVQMDAGHAVNMEDITNFNDTVTRFITRCLTS